MSFLWLAAAHMDTSKFPAEIKNLIKYLHDLCTDITGTTEEQIQQVREGNFPDDEKIKRYTLCIWRNTVMDVNMKLNVTYFKDLLDKMRPELFELKKKCLDKARNSGFKEKYELTYAVHKCLYEADPEHFVFF
ncbi:hypothetical protein JTB14_018107 [Gonioctena quinquepunctata]|nr:hypothetical protein JTB14_018107 [Gonioctena quinquepunctata]